MTYLLFYVSNLEVGGMPAAQAMEDPKIRDYVFTLAASIRGNFNRRKVFRIFRGDFL